MGAFTETSSSKSYSLDKKVSQTTKLKETPSEVECGGREMNPKMTSIKNRSVLPQRQRICDLSFMLEMFAAWHSQV